MTHPKHASNSPIYLFVYRCNQIQYYPSIKELRKIFDKFKKSDFILEYCRADGSPLSSSEDKNHLKLSPEMLPKVAKHINKSPLAPDLMQRIRNMRYPRDCFLKKHLGALLRITNQDERVYWAIYFYTVYNEKHFLKAFFSKDDYTLALRNLSLIPKLTSTKTYETRVNSTFFKEAGLITKENRNFLLVTNHDELFKQKNKNNPELLAIFNDLDTVPAKIVDPSAEITRTTDINNATTSGELLAQALPLEGFTQISNKLVTPTLSVASFWEDFQGPSVISNKRGPTLSELVKADLEAKRPRLGDNLSSTTNVATVQSKPTTISPKSQIDTTQESGLDAAFEEYIQSL